MQNVKGNNVPVDDWPVELQLLRYWITESDRMNTLQTRWDQNAFLFCTATSFAWPQPFEQMRELRMKNGNPEKSRLQVSEHFALLCSHQGSGDKYRGPKEEYFQLFFFDDFWASANPELAESIMRYSFNWDPFSDGKKTY
jgi:hypothetical protein